MTGQKLGVDLTDDRNVAQLGGEGEVQCAEAAVAGQKRRAAALREPGLAKDDGRAGGHEVDRHAGDDLVAAAGDGGKAVYQRQEHRDEDRGGEPDPGRAGDGGGRAAGERAGEHLAFQADVENARALGIEAREAGKQKRHGKPDGGVEDQDQDVEEVHQARSPGVAGTAGVVDVKLAKIDCTVGRNRFSRAPANRITSPWMMTIMSREMAGISKASSAPPW